MKGSNEVRVGIVLIAGLVITVVGTLWLQGASWRESVRLEAVVREAGQLLPGNSVKVRGVPIGRVRSIQVEEGGETVRISLELEEGARLPADAGVLITPESLFGDWQVEIVSRSQYPRYVFTSPPPTAGDGTRVLPGYTLPDMSRLTAAADEIATNVTTLTDRVEVAFTEQTARNISEAIENIQRVSQRLADLVEQQGVAVQAVTEEVGRAASEVADAASIVRVSFAEVARITGNGVLDSLVVDTRATVSNLRSASSELTETTRAASQALARADSTMAGIGRITARVEAGEGTLGRLLNDEGMALRAEEALAEFTLLMKDVRENPRRYVRLSIF